MNFSIPDDIKQAFNEAFEGENKSAVVAALMKQAVDARRRNGTEAERRARFEKALARLDKLCRAGRTYSDEEIRRAREDGRP